MLHTSNAPVVAGLPHDCGALAAAGGVHKVVHDDAHDGGRAVKLPVRQKRFSPGGRRG